MMNSEQLIKEEWRVYSGETYEQDYKKFVNESWGVCCNFELAGQGKVTSKKCGTFLGFYGCLRVDLHDKVTLEGKNFKGRVYIKKRFHSCDSPSCPICYRSWGSREANAIDYRLKEASKKLGVIEHFIISPPKEQYSLSYEKLKTNCIKALRDRGVMGSCLVFHPFRYIGRDEAHRKGVKFGFNFSPHWHALGFLSEGYSKCRRCKKNVRSYISGAGKLLESRGGVFACAGCDGFEAKTRRCYEKDHYIVKVQAARKTVGGTAYYELQHCGFVRGKSRARVVSWWGVVSYAKMKIKKRERHVDLCPICQHELARLKYVGNGNPVSEWWLTKFSDRYLMNMGLLSGLKFQKGCLVMDCRFKFSENCLRDQVLGDIGFEYINGKEHRCGKPKIRSLMGNTQIVLHWLPWGTYIDVILFCPNGTWIRLFSGKWDLFKDYDWQLGYHFGSDED